MISVLLIFAIGANYVDPWQTVPMRLVCQNSLWKSEPNCPTVIFQIVILENYKETLTLKVEFMLVMVGAFNDQRADDVIAPLTDHFIWLVECQEEKPGYHCLLFYMWRVTGHGSQGRNIVRFNKEKSSYVDPNPDRLLTCFDNAKWSNLLFGWRPKLL